MARAAPARGAQAVPETPAARPKGTARRTLALEVYTDGSAGRPDQGAAVGVHVQARIGHGGWMMAESRWACRSASACLESPAVFGALGIAGGHDAHDAAPARVKSHRIEALAAARGLAVAEDVADSLAEHAATAVEDVTLVVDARGLLGALAPRAGRKDDAALCALRGAAARIRRRHRCTVRVEFCRGHAGVVGNARAHALAGAARRTAVHGTGSDSAASRGGVGRRRRRREAKRGIVVVDETPREVEDDNTFARRITEGTRNVVPPHMFWASQWKHLRKYERAML